MGDLPEHMKRVVTERDELKDKLEKLNGFTNDTEFDTKVPDPEDRMFLHHQAGYMTSYLDVLELRLDKAAKAE